MTKKNAKKRAARARQAANGGKYENHLRLVGGIENGNSLGFFETLSNGIRAAHPHAALHLVAADNRLEVQIAGHLFAICTVLNTPPEWPAYAWVHDGKRALGRRDGAEWQCETLDDVLAVLRWPDARPSKAFASVNEIRDDYENPSKHVWVRVASARFGGSVYECQRCKVTLNLNRYETVEEVARMGFENWRERAAGKVSRANTITREMEVGYIPPQCTVGPDRKQAFDAITELIESLRPVHVGSILVGRIPAVASSASYEAAARQVRDLAENPKYFAQSASVQKTVTRGEMEALIARGATEKGQVQKIAVHKADASFSVPCATCERWIWCGHDKYRGTCVCGQRYEITVEGPVAGGLPEGWLCMNCGEQEPRPIARDSANEWHEINSRQRACDICFHMQHIGAWWVRKRASESPHGR